MRLRTALLIAAVATALSATPAQAAITYDFSFGSKGNGPGQFFSSSGQEGGPNNIAVNQSTGNPSSGHVYVTDRLSQRIQEFDAAGDFVRMLGRGVNQTSGGDICPRPGNPGDVCRAGVASSGRGGFSGPRGIAVDSSNGVIYVQDGGNNRIQKFTATGEFLIMWGKAVNQTTGGDVCPRLNSLNDVCQAGAISGDGTPGQFGGWGFRQPLNSLNPGTNVTVDGSGNVYVGDPNAYPRPRLQKFDSSGAFIGQVAPQFTSPWDGGIENPANIVATAAGDVYVNDLNYLVFFDASDFTLDGSSATFERKFAPGMNFTSPAVDPHNEYLFAVGSGRKCENPDLVNFSGGGPYGTAVYEFHPTGQEVDCTVISYPSVTGVAAAAAGPPSAHKLYIADQGAGKIDVYTTPVATPPTIAAQSTTQISTDQAAVRAEVSANLDDTTYHVEYGPSPCSTDPCTSTPESASIGAAYAPVTVSAQLAGLEPDNTYYYRFVATNGKGSVPGPDRHLRTYLASALDPDCPNNLARQQTGAAFLLDCRAYELVSAEDQGGYNVESDLVAGQSPFGGYPLAEDRALYAVHNGSIPNTGNPTNHGPDPYVTTRDAANGHWVTEYVGIPADAPSAAPFSSTLSGADPSLHAFAFSGPEVCDPCFADGSAGIPLRRPDGSLVQGMQGSIPVALPESAGIVEKPLSGDGGHFVFGSKQQFEQDGNFNSIDATLYERDLDTDTTEVVSTDENGAPIQNGDGVAELGISDDGSRVVIGRLVSTDAAGNRYYHLYLHLAGEPSSIDLTPGATAGVLYAGMTPNASRVYFTAKDALATIADPDTDAGADLYGAQISGTTAALTRISTGEAGTGDTDFCDPVANSSTGHWNALPGTPADCSVLAVGGAGGVATAGGGIYFLSPEELDTSAATQPVVDAPNLYLARPGQAPRFVATLESALTGPQPPRPIYAFEKSFTGSLGKATGIAVDHASGDFYVLDINIAAKAIFKFDAAGKPVQFTAGAAAGTNKLTGSDSPTGAFAPNSGLGTPAQIAVNQSNGKLYVPDYGKNRVDVFQSTGQYDSQLTVNTPSAVALHPTTHDVYVTNRGASQVTIFPAAGGPSTSFSVSANSANPMGIAVDSTGRVYVANASRTALYSAAGAFVKVIDPNPSFGVVVDSADNVLITEANRFAEFDAAGNPTGGSDGLGAPVGAGQLTKPIGIALDSSGNAHVVDQTSGSTSAVAIFHLSLPPDPSIDSPLVLDSLHEAGVRRTADFQTTTDGDLAAFQSVLPLTGFDSAGHYEIFRYDALADALDCASCNQTEQAPATDATLATDGLSLTDDGRLFFTTGEALVQRDTNQKKDAYQYSGGKAELISTGQDPFDSGLLSASTDGTDVFFFTRQTLTANDQNGSLMKIYTAREGGGFFVIPPSPQCAASDECHGPGSPTPPPPTIGTVEGRGGNLIEKGAKPRPCKAGFVRKHGRCVKRSKRHPKRNSRGARR